MSYVNPVNKPYCLEQICAANFNNLLTLIPDLLSYRTGATGRSPDYASLHLRVMEQSAHTMTVQLTYLFNKSEHDTNEPAVRIRLYLDAKLAEVLSDHAREPVSRVFRNLSASRKIVDYKWRLNYFLHKWLDHCLNKNYAFCEEAVQAAEIETA